MGRDPAIAGDRQQRHQFQSTRPVWGATVRHGSQPRRHRISIHAPRVGRDGWRRFRHSPLSNFNPRAPCGARRSFRRCPSPSDHFNPRAPCGARPVCMIYHYRTTAFQSTRPVWGATFSRFWILCSSIQFQSTRPVWGATCAHVPLPTLRSNFNPRAPCGARLVFHGFASFAKNFNPRAPCGARPRSLAKPSRSSYFNPRAPCGARHDWWWLSTAFSTFQSTRPVWGATRLDVVVPDPADISIHAPRVGRDPADVVEAIVEGNISIHAPRVGRDYSFAICLSSFAYFNPRAPCGARQQI